MLADMMMRDGWYQVGGDVVAGVGSEETWVCLVCVAERDERGWGAERQGLYMFGGRRRA